MINEGEDIGSHKIMQQEFLTKKNELKKLQ